MNVIFLDIDGVIQAYNSKKRFEVDTKELRDKISKDLNMDYSIYHSFDVSACYLDWDKDAVDRIKRIIKETDSMIVISSDWRSGELPYKMRDLLKIWDMDQFWKDDTRCVDPDKVKEEMKEAYNLVTANPRWCYRSIEILDYVYKHNEITNFVAIDDMNIEEGLDGHFVKTYNLINDEQADRCIEILKDKNFKIKDRID